MVKGYHTSFNCFSGPLPQRSNYNRSYLGVCFRESLVFRLHSEIDQIHLTIEAQFGTACLPTGECDNDYLILVINSESFLIKQNTVT